MYGRDTVLARTSSGCRFWGRPPGRIASPCSTRSIGGRVRIHYSKINSANVALQSTYVDSFPSISGAHRLRCALGHFPDEGIDEALVTAGQTIIGAQARRNRLTVAPTSEAMIRCDNGARDD